MDILDKLFSKEIKRRTGAHAIKIDAELKTSARKRARVIGFSALKASTKKKPQISSNSRRSHDSCNTHDPRNTQDQKLSPARKGTFLHRLNVRFPWLKLVSVVAVGIIAIADLLDLTISRVDDPYDRIKIAPMSHHVRVTERILKGKKLIALTFDDGPSAATTPALLDILSKKDTPATFFMLGNMAQANPDLVKRIEKEHHDVASHTMFHQNLTAIPLSAVEADLKTADDTFNTILGHGPAYTRPPYGNFNEDIKRMIKTPLILWSVDSEDWRNKNAQATSDVIMAEAHDGAIILMHDIYQSSVEAVPTVIDRLRSAGYEFVTVKELAEQRGASLAPSTPYYNLLP